MKQKKKKRVMYPLLWFFAAFILIFTVWDLLSPVKNFSDMENRYLKQKPSIHWDSLMDNSYSANYESYINDQFILRDNWIDLKSRTENLFLKIENNGIVYGKNDTMFAKFTSFKQEQLEKNMGFLQEFLQGKENVTFAIIPSAYEILGEKLPYGLHQVNQKAEIKRIYSALQGKAKLLDFYPILQVNKDHYIYYRTDHHWTTDGAYLAYAEFCKAQGWTPVPLNELDRKTMEGFYGTYFNKSKKTSAKGDTLTYYEIPVTEVTVDGVKKDGFLDQAQLEKRDKYAAFLYGNNGVTVLKSDHNRNKQEKKISRILLIKDSFSNCFAPFLTYHYDEVYVVDLRSLPKGMTELMEKTEFDDIFMMYNFMNFESDTNLYRLKY